MFITFVFELFYNLVTFPFLSVLPEPRPLNHFFKRKKQKKKKVNRNVGQAAKGNGIKDGHVRLPVFMP
ncbi:hypothetical protein DRF65_13705 [Chryseobacterium pennae]|uniref:Uncharacterized protein n=1 Tax=Chryseobacterium pennae TaxID=2258962 RepID=A0A3D9C7R5_9FLAO|nr:hypothetical protein DRF65_13705 [Chryseobacterium pennae]